MNEKLKITTVSLAIVGVIGLTACGGGGSGSDGSTATTGSMITSGVVTGFGSVYVDGVEFETDGSSFSLDDGDDGIEDEDGLAVGMVVTVTGTVHADGKTGTAKHIEFDDELEGIVNANNVASDGTGTMTVMGQTVIVESTSVFESDVAAIDSVDKVATGNVVEVSGFSTGDGTVYATRIEVKLATHGGEEIEVKGIISNLAAGTFDLGGLTVDFSSALFDDSLPDGTLSDGQYVEVKSTAGFNLDDELIASEIELEDDGDMDLDGARRSVSVVGATPRYLASIFLTAMFAFPSAGGAVVRICSCPSLIPVISLCFAFGWTRTEMMVLPPSLRTQDANSVSRCLMR